ncbi:hypothetical protein T484DRAFT_1767546, partial [Baffinella frigidus]
MTAPVELLPDTPVEILIPGSAVLDLPTDGVLEGGGLFALSSSAAAGPVLAESIASFPLVGSFSGLTTLDFPARAAAGEVAAFTVTFTPASPMAAGGLVVLYLPGWTRAAGSTAFDQCVASDAVVTSVAWDAESAELSLAIALPIPARQNTTVLIPSGIGLRLPAAGLPLPSAGLRIASRVMSLIPSSPVLRFPPVGRFLASSLGFARALYTFNPSTNATDVTPLPVSPGDTVALHLSFTADMDISAGDNITISLPGFAWNFSAESLALLGGNWTVSWGTSPVSGVSGGDSTVFGGNSTNLTVPEGDSSNGTDAGVSFEAAPVLVITAGVDVAAGELVMLVIPESANLSLPARGLTANKTDLTIGFHGASGPVQPTPLASTQSVGLLTRRPRARFLPRIAGAVSALHLTFSFAAAFEGETVLNISLPGFVGPEGPVEVLFDSAPLLTTSNTSIQRPTSTLASLPGGGLVLSLTFHAANAVQGGAPSGYGPLPSGELAITIPASAMVTLPAAGVVADGSGMAVDVIPGGAGSRVRAAFLAEPVGAFLGTPSLFFSPAKAGEVHNLTISFATNTGLDMYESVALSLPGFTGPALRESLTVGDALRVRVEWNASSARMRLTMDCGTRLPPNTALRLPLDAALGLTLPWDGLRTNAPLSISGGAAAGPILPQGVAARSIGHLHGPSLRFGNPTA